MPKLTKRVVDAAAADPNGGEVFLWDTEVKGFGLRVKPTGAKAFVLKYRIGTKTKRFTISKVGSPYTVEEARGRAEDLLRGVKDGFDPMAAKVEAREAMTVAELADLYLAEGPAEKPNKKASSWAADRSNIERHIKPLLGGKLAKLLTQADVAKFQRDVAAGKTAKDEKTGFRGRAIVEGGKGIAARSLAVLGAMLQFAESRSIVRANPAKGVKPYRMEKKERFLSEAEVTKLAETLTAMEASGEVNSTMAAALRMLILTGCRKMEILGLRWSEVDFERSALVLSDLRSKTGAKRVPIAAAALEILAGLPRAESDYVFPAVTGTKHVVGLQKAWGRVRTKAGLDDVRIHDMRHSFASFAAADGTSLFLIGKVLGHTQARTTEKYAHLANDPLRAVADRTASRIAAAMKTGAGAPSAEVVRLTRRGRRAS